MIDVNVLQTAVGVTRVRTPNALIRVALNKGRTLPLLKLALYLRHNRKTRRNIGHVRAAWGCTRPPRWLLVLQKQVFSLYHIVRVLTYPHAGRATGASCRGTMTQSIRRNLAMAGECTINAPTISAQASVQASCLWDSFERQQIALWFDNYRRYINGVDPHSPDKTLNVTAVAVLHTTELPRYHGLPSLDVVAQGIPAVVDYLLHCVGLLLQRSTIPDGAIRRTWVRAPLDYARSAVVSLNWRPFMLSHLKCGSHVELLEFVRGFECLQVRTRRTVAFLIDMKIFYALLKMSYAVSYAPWHVDQFLLGHPLLYGVWHPYKYSVEITYKAFAPIIKFLAQGWDLKVGAVVPMKVKLRHMEKTIVGSLLATAANRARLESTTQVLMSNLAELSAAQRVGLRCLLALKALLFSYSPALLALGVLVRECNWKGWSVHSTSAAKECIGMSTVLMMNVIPSEKWLNTEYLPTNTVALLFWSDWHSQALGCLFFEEYGEALLSRLLMRSKEVGNAQSLQQTTDIFLTLPPTLPGEKKCQGVLTQKSVDKYTKHVRLFIQNITHAWFPIAVLQEDKYVVKRLDETPRMQFPGVLSRTRGTEQQIEPGSA